MSRRRPSRRLVMALAALSMGICGLSHGGVFGDGPQRQELDVAPPASLDFDSAEPFEMPGDQRLEFAVIASSINVHEDGLIRYVLVATSPSGGQNVLFETLDCKRQESKTTSRWSPHTQQWTPVDQARWIGLKASRNSANRVLAQGIFCLNGLNRSSVAVMRQELKRQ